MENTRIVTRTTDGRFVGETFSFCPKEMEVTIAGNIFQVVQVLPNKIVSYNYIIEFKWI